MANSKPESDPVAHARLDYPPTIKRRWGLGERRAGDVLGHAAIERMLTANAEHIEAFVRGAEQFDDSVVGSVPLDAALDDPSPRWNQTWMPASDAVGLVTALASHKPKTYLEIGSGHSTRFARHAIHTLGLTTKVISIDPQPRAEVDALCDVVVRERLEDVDLMVFEQLVRGDVVFFDGSHRCLQNSDVTVFFLEVVPSLPAGVLIGVHDIFWPADYPAGFADRWYSEQYILGAYLLGLGDRARVHLATNGLDDAQRARLLTGIPADALASIPNPRGASLWFSRSDS